MLELTQQAKAEYERLTKLQKEQEAALVKTKNDIRPIAIYLKEVGIIEKETRNRGKGQ